MYKVIELFVADLAVELQIDLPGGVRMSEDLGNADLSKANPSNAMLCLPPTMTVTRTIIIANVAVFGGMVASGMSFVSPDGLALLNWGANYGPFTLNGQWWRLVTYMFLHFGIVHIGMNMWILWGLARLVERLVGSVGFGIAYMVSGIAGGIASLAWNPVGISAGASGAVFGTAGTLLGFVVLRNDTIPSAVRNQMLKSMATFLILNLAVGMSVPQIDMAAHVGGFVGGTICGLILSQPLSQGILARRKFRNLIAVMAAAVILPLAVVALPEAPPDINSEMQRLSHVENEIYDTFNADEQLAATGNIDDVEFADRIESSVLPAWIKLKEDIESLSTLEYADRDYMEKLLRYVRSREEIWRLLVQGLRDQDDSKIKRAYQLSIESREKLQNEINSSDGKQ